MLNGTVSVISSDPPCKDSAMPDLQTKSDQKCGRNIRFSDSKCLFFFLVVSPLLLKNKECTITFAEKLQINEQFKETNILKKFQGYRCKSGMCIFARRVN